MRSCPISKDPITAVGATLQTGRMHAGRENAPHTSFAKCTHPHAAAWTSLR